MLGDFFGGLPSAPSKASTHVFGPAVLGQGGFSFSGSFGGTTLSTSLGFSGGSFSGFCLTACAVPVARGSAKVAENESPLPATRVFVNDNFYANHQGVSNVNRETIGGEWAFDGHRTSIGIRVPFFQAFVRDSDVSGHQMGDMSLLIKHVLTQPAASGGLASVGAVVTLPTAGGPTLALEDGTSVHPIVFQPFLGYAWRWPRFFIQGFSSVMVPSDSRDVSILFDDVSVGFQQAAAPSRVVPMLELHVNTPLTDRDPAQDPHYRDSVDFTGGVNVSVGGRSSVAFGVGVPLKPRESPRLFDVEALARLNIRF